MGVIPEEQKPPDLEAIRARNEKRKQRFLDHLSETAMIYAFAEPLPADDIDTLLAEVERLRKVLLAHGSRDRDGDAYRAAETPQCGVSCEHKHEAEKIAAETGRTMLYHITP